MFGHLLLYSFKTMLRNKETLIWSLVFPLALGTFMYMAFGELYEAEEKFKAIPVAVVEQKSNESFVEAVKELSKDEAGEKKLLDARFVDMEAARKSLADEEVTGIFVVSDDISMIVNESSVEESVLKVFLEEYVAKEAIIMDVLRDNPDGLNAAVKQLRSEETYFTSISTSNGNQDIYTNYFYAIFAMACLFASFATAERIIKFLPVGSALGVRRNLTPITRWTMLLAEYIPLLVINYVAQLILLCYLTFVGVDFGDNYFEICLLLLMGTNIGVSIGVIIGIMPKLSREIKNAICTVVSMSCSVMADLCASGIKDAIEHTAPLINRINPAAVITDSFYALNVYGAGERYISNMLILAVMSFCMLVISVIMFRRNSYASL